MSKSSDKEIAEQDGCKGCMQYKTCIGKGEKCNDFVRQTRRQFSEVAKMSIKTLKNEIAISKVSADNENYLIRFTIAEGMEVLKEFEQLEAENKRLKTVLKYSIEVTEAHTLL